MNSLAKLKKKTKKFPNAPGVYIWKNKKGEPIYIGRAGSLKKRIASYFLKNRDSKTAEMITRAHSIKFQKTDTLLEAVVLEANLIKKYWPKYNVEEKDDKSFIYLVITRGEFPKPIIIRGRELERSFGKPQDDKQKLAIFGPYQSYRILRTVLELLRPIFPFSTCQQTSRKRPELVEGQHLKPCFHYQIGLCPGVCINKADKKEYKKNIRNLILFFRGDKKRLLNKLKKENSASARAGRDGPEKTKALQHVRDTALLAESNSLLNVKGQMSNVRRIEGYDISHLSGKEPVGAMVVFVNGQRASSQYRLFKIKGSAVWNNSRELFHKDDLSMLREVLERRLRHTDWPLPDIVFVDGGLLQAKVARDVLTKHKIFVPVIGLSKGGKHAGSAYATDKLVALNVKPIGKEVLLTSKKLFQEVRNEAHRFAISFHRKRRKKGFMLK